MRTASSLLALALLTACGNHPPTIGAASLDPAAPTTEDDVTVTVTGVDDEDGDDVSLSYAWTVNDAAVTGTETLSADNYERGDVIVVTVTPSDGEDDGEAVTAEATVANARPVVTSVDIAPQGADSADLLTASATGTDADEDALTYTFTWTIDGAAAGDGSTLDAPVKDSVVVATGIASDGDVVSEPLASAPITVLNGAPPTPGTPTLLPDTTWLPANLTCTVPAVVDPDEDPVSYKVRFLVDGVEHSVVDAVDRAATVPKAETAGGGVWTCQGQALDDDTGVSDWSAVSVAVDQACTEADVTLQTIQTASLAYNNGTWWNDNLLRAYTYGSSGGNEDIVGWSVFDLADEPGIRGVVAAELELYASGVYSTPDVVVVQTSGASWAAEPPTREDLPRTGEISDSRTDLVASRWESFVLDVDAWTDGPAPDRLEVVVGVDNLKLTYSYAYFGTFNTAGTEPRLHLTVCRTD